MRYCVGKEQCPNPACSLHLCTVHAEGTKSPAFTSEIPTPKAMYMVQIPILTQSECPDYFKGMPSSCVQCKASKAGTSLWASWAESLVLLMLSPLDTGGFPLWRLLSLLRKLQGAARFLPRPPPLQTRQAQCPQSLLRGHSCQPLPKLWCPPMNTFKYPNALFKLWGP